MKGEFCFNFIFCGQNIPDAVVIVDMHIRRWYNMEWIDKYDGHKIMQRTGLTGQARPDGCDQADIAGQT